MRRSNRYFFCLGTLVAATACSSDAPRGVRAARQAPIEAPEPRPSASPQVAKAPTPSASATVTPVAPPPPEASIDDGPRLTSIAYKTWIWPRPNASGRFLGYMRVGNRVKLKSTELVPGMNCRKGFYAIEPRGYVCNDRTVTLEATSDFIEANAHTLPVDGPFPYRYALSNGAPMYARVPTAREQKRYEVQYGKAGDFVPMGMWQKGHEHLAVTDPIAPSHPMPAFLTGGRDAYGRQPLGLLKRSIPHGSMLAYTRAFDFGGRTFLLSADLTVVPADRVRQFRPSRFRGTKLGGDVKLPIAFMRVRARPQYRLQGDALVATGESWPVRTFVALTGDERQHDGETYLEVTGGLYIAASDATVIRDYGKRPFGVREGEKWIIVSIREGTLIAYDDLTPVYATLMSPGQGGVPRRGGDLVKDSTTPLGTYRLTFKDRAATMSPEFGEDRKFWIADVPFTQYFSPPFALHGAYWHEKFGELMSGGCVNVSPIDAHWLFGWTDPQVPEGWQGTVPSKGDNTAIVVRM